MCLNRDKKNVIKSWTIYCLFSCLSVFWGDFSTLSLNTMFGMILLFGIGLTFFTTTLGGNLQRKIDYCWIIGGIIFIVLFLVGKTAEVGWGTRQTLLILGTWTDPNEFASFFAIAIPLSVYHLFQKEKNIFKILNALVIAGGIYVVLMSGSRGALAAILISVVVEICVLVRLSPKKIIVMLICLVLVGIVVKDYLLPLIPENTIERLSLDAIMKDSGSGRKDIWEEGFTQFFEGGILRWLLGYGYGGLVIKTGLAYMPETTTIHNQFFQQLICYGFLGITLYLTLLITVFREFFRNKKHYLGPLCGMLAMGMTITMGPSYKILWILIFQAGLSYLDTEIKEEQVDENLSNG